MESFNATTPSDATNVVDDLKQARNKKLKIIEIANCEYNMDYTDF